MRASAVEKSEGKTTAVLWAVGSRVKGKERVEVRLASGELGPLVAALSGEE